MARKRKEEEGYNMAESVETISTIECDVCGAKHEVHDDSLEARNYFINEGWRCPSTKVYCPDCASKKLKPI